MDPNKLPPWTTNLNRPSRAIFTQTFSHEASQKAHSALFSSLCQFQHPSFISAFFSRLSSFSLGHPFFSFVCLSDFLSLYLYLFNPPFGLTLIRYSQTSPVISTIFSYSLYYSLFLRLNHFVYLDLTFTPNCQDSFSFGNKQIFSANNRSLIPVLVACKQFSHISLWFLQDSN